MITYLKAKYSLQATKSSLDEEEVNKLGDGKSDD